MKKVFIGTLLVLFCGLSLFAQDNLRNSVAVVRPSYTDEQIAFFGKMSSALIKNGYIISSRVLKAMELGKGFGSGFVHITPSGEAYILTNKHVVRDAPAANITFFTENNDSLVFQNCPVVAVSPKLDIALVALPSDAKIEKSLTFYTQPISDGQDVWSAGYPGLGNKPVWQLGKGIISNQSVRDELLADPSVTFVFQHTAQIDPGSSGGPLLIKKETGYEVIGINTWKARGRENAGFSIPAKAIVQFIEESLVRENRNPVKEIAETLFKEPDVKLIAQHISFDWVTQMTAPSVDAMIAKMSAGSKELIIDAFQEGEPIKAFRLLIADAIIAKIKKEKVVLEQPEIRIINDSEIQAIFTANGKEYICLWIKEQNTWKIGSFSLLPMADIMKKEKPERKVAEFRTNLSLQVDFPQVDGYDQFYFFAWEQRLAKYLYTHLGAGYGVFLEPSYYDDEEDERVPYINLEFGLGTHVPIRVSSMRFIPYLTGVTGMEVGGELDQGLYVGFKGGINVGFKVGKRTVLYAGPEFNLKFLVPPGDLDLSNQRSAFGLKVGIYL